MDTGHVTVYFRGRKFLASADHIDEYRPHVYRIDVPPLSPSWLLWLVVLLPKLLQCWIQRPFPQWFLPETILVKERNPDRPEDLDNERHYYQHLQDLQGTYIPRFFGEAAVYSDAGRTPALLLEYVRGTSLHALPIKRLVSRKALKDINQGCRLGYSDFGIPDRELWDALRRMYDKLTERGVLHGDAKLDKFLLSDGGFVVAIDFEFARSLPLPSGETNEEGLMSLISFIQTYARDAARRRRQRRNLRAKGPEFWERADMFCSSTSSDGTETE